MKKLAFILGIAIVLLFSSCSKNGPKIVFEENFDGTSLNENVWNYELGNGCPNKCGFGNNERQTYTKQNAQVEDGYLTITATKEGDNYYSARLNTKDKIEFQYGTVEVRAQLPTGKGMWPAVWMLGHDISEKGWPLCGEIDIMEYVGREPNTAFNTLHTQDSHGNSKNSKKTVIQDLEQGFHVYKLNWSQDKMDFFVDDELLYTFKAEERTEAIWPFDKPYFLILNLAVGGNFGGPEVDDSIFPREFVVDYVKVYQD
ncbi:MAG TPA: glycoside hydrolase family 16 protein [Mangrovimonas sp.]|nr:glycoside hydrolase family 16 protein [Mangrovimonas sp.]